MINKKDILKEIEEFKNKPLQEDSNILSEIDAIRKQAEIEDSKKVGSALYPQTMESKYLQPIYDIADPIMKGLSILEKPLSVSMGAGRTVGKLLSGQDEPLKPIYEEITSPFPTQEGSLMADLRESGYGTDEMLSLPENVKAQFPKAASVVESMSSPVNIADAVSSTAIGAAIPSISKSTSTAMKVGDVGLAKKALKRGSEGNLKYISELEKSGKLESLAALTLKDKKVRSNIHNPEKMIRYLEGENVEVTNPVTFKREIKAKREGVLSEVGKKLNDKISEMSSSLPQFDIAEIEKNIINRLTDKMNEIGSGFDYSIDAVKREISKYTKTAPDSDLEFIDNTPTHDFTDLVKIKRGAADQIFKMKSTNYANIKNPALKEFVAQNIWEEVNDQINKLAVNTKNQDLLEMNNKYSDYQKLRELFGDKNIKQSMIPTLLEDLLPMAAIGGGATAMTGSPYVGFLAAGSYPMARGAVDSFAHKSPSKALNLRRGMIEPALDIVSQVPKIATASAMVSQKIARNSDKILEDVPLFIGRLSQKVKTPNDKILFDEVLNIIENEPESLASILPTLTQNYPDIFESDKYGRVNGRIINPILKQKAINDIIKSNGSSLDSAKKMEKLINDNTLED